MRLLDDPDDLELLGGGVPPASSPHPRSCFFWAAGFPAPGPPRLPSARLPRDAVPAPRQSSLPAWCGRPGGACQLRGAPRPGVIQALGNAFLATKLGDAVFTTQPLQHDPDLVFGREVPPGRPADVLHHLLGASLGRHGFRGRLRAYLRSFVTTTKPQSFLPHNLKPAPRALTAGTAPHLVPCFAAGDAVVGSEAGRRHPFTRTDLHYATSGTIVTSVMQLSSRRPGHAAQELRHHVLPHRAQP